MEHRLTHMPYRSWCEDCVAGRSRRDAHSRSGEEALMPVIAMDYAFLGKEVGDKEETSSPILVITDSHSTGVWA